MCGSNQAKELCKGRNLIPTTHLVQMLLLDLVMLGKGHTLVVKNLAITKLRVSNVGMDYYCNNENAAIYIR